LPNRNYVLGTLLVLAGIVYVSLYPFHWRTPPLPGGPLHQFALSWNHWPESRGDFIANLLLYLPWGFFGVRSLGRDKPAMLRVVIATALGVALSLCMETSQAYIAERYTDMRDVYSNTLGSLGGAIAGLAPIGNSRMNILRDSRIAPFPALLLAAFVASHLYPFMPVIDAHKYLTAVRPLLNTASLNRVDLILTGITWLVICYLAETLFGRRSAFLASIAIAALIFGGDIVIIDARLSLASVLGAALAYLLWFALLRFIPGRVSLIAIAFAAVIMITRLLPFRLSPVGHGFEWVPFFALLRAPIDIGLPAMIEKLFLYGGLIWLLMRAGLRLWRATVAVALLLLFSSIVEMYMPGRDAGITDALLALLIGTLLRLTLPPRRQRDRDDEEPEAKPA
jgi:VanZ family protein